MDLGQREVEEATQQRVHLVGTEALGERRRVDDVAEENRHRLALALQRAPRRENLLGEMSWRIGFRHSRPARCRFDRLAAAGTESRPLRQLGAARRTARTQWGAAGGAEARAEGDDCLAAWARAAGALGHAWNYPTAGRRRLPHPLDEDRCLNAMAVAAGRAGSSAATQS